MNSLRFLLASMTLLGSALAADLKIRPETPEVEAAIVNALKSLEAPGVTLRLVKESKTVLRFATKAPFNPETDSRVVIRDKERFLEVNPEASVPRQEVVRKLVMKELGITEEMTPEQIVVRLSGADLNGDGKIDLADFAILAANFGKTGENLPGDLNGDGKVDSADVVLFSKLYPLP